MKIASTDLAMQSQHTALTRQESFETLRAWRPPSERPSNASRPAAQPTAALPAAPANPSTVTDISASAMDAADSDPFLSIIKRMVEMLTGEEVRVFDMQDFSAKMSHVEINAGRTRESLQTTNAAQAAGLAYERQTVFETFEQTKFSAAGIVRTSDGQEISFKLDMEMTYYYRETSSVSVRAGAAERKDPLVVNFGGTAAQLAAAPNQRFRFDIDGDGTQDSLPLFASGSGYLALDRNNNGMIDVAEELFGPQTDNGFAELARLDEDGNQWIDAGDSAFDKLLVWTPAAEGNGSLRALADLGIGALGIMHRPTPFALRGSANTDLGQIRDTGLYLSNDGRSGSVQEIDLTL